MASVIEKQCPECGTRHTTQRGLCAPLSERTGPPVTSPDHPSNNGSWARVVAVAGLSRTPQ